MRSTIVAVMAIAALLQPARATTLHTKLFISASAHANCVLHSPSAGNALPVLSVQCTKGAPSARVELIAGDATEIHVAHATGTPARVTLARRFTGQVFAMVNF